MISVSMARTTSASEYEIWNKFVSAFRDGSLTVEKIRPYDELGAHFKPVLLGYLDSLRIEAAA